MQGEPSGALALASTRTVRGRAAAAILAAGALAFLPVLFNGFVAFDDGLYVTENPHVLSGITWEGLRWAFAFPRNGETYWHPLTWLSLMLDVEMFGPRAWAIHLVNLLLHLGSALLLFQSVGEMTGRWGRSAAVALLWTVHPIQVEAVAWAVERKTVLAGILGFAALLAYARYARRPSAGGMACVAALLAAGLLAKPMLVTLPFLFLLLDAWPLGRTGWCRPETGDGTACRATWGRLLGEKVPLFVIVAAALVFGVLTRPPPRDEVAAGLRLANAIVGNWGYFAKVLWPARLSVFYPQVTGIAAWKVILAGAGLVAVLGGLSWPRARPAALVGGLWFLGCLFPMSGIVRGGLWPGMADRFAYLPLAGLSLAAVWSIAPVVEGRRWRRGPAILVAAAVAALTARANAYARDWRDSESLFRTAVASSDRATLMRVNLGKALEAKGRLEEARVVYEELTVLAPELADGWVNLGALRHARGDLAGAEALYQKALEVDPQSGEALYDLGLLRKLEGRSVDALALVERAVQGGFRKAVAFNQLGVLYLGSGRRSEAEQALRTAWDMDARDWLSGYNLAQLLSAQGRSQEATAVLAEARTRAVRNGDDPAVIDRALGALVRPAATGR